MDDSRNEKCGVELNAGGELGTWGEMEDAMGEETSMGGDKLNDN